MNYILVIFTVVAMAGGYRERDWRPISEFKNEAACVHAARQMDMRGADRFRCLPTDTVQKQNGGAR